MRVLTIGAGIGIIAGLFLIVYLIRKNKSKKKDRLLQAEREEQTKRQIERDKLIKDAFDNYYKQIFEGQEFVNQDTINLDDFIINEEINDYDLHKLAQLNNIKVEFLEGWNELALEMIRELDRNGWNRKVVSIKEKFGELRFYADTEAIDILDKYTAISRYTCEVCGKPGSTELVGNWYQTLCKEHL